MDRLRPFILKLMPAASRRVHLLLAALTWTIVGIVLCIVGIRWILQGDEVSPWLILPLAVVIGLGKGIFVLRRTARRNVRRIIDRGDGRCVGGFLSWKTWLLIIGMMIGGRLLRGSDLPVWIIGTIYAGIGMALASSAVTIWNALRSLGRESPMPQR